MVERLKVALEILSSILMVLLASVMLSGFWAASRAPVQSPSNAGAVRAEAPLPKEPLSLDGAAIKGSPSAKVVIVVYSDFQCPYCGQFARDTLPAIETEFVRTGKVKLAFRHLPLESLHPKALLASAAAECAGRAGLFWEMHDRLFANPKGVDKEMVQRVAKELGVQDDEFAACLSADTVNARIDADVADAKTLSLTGTPSFFIGVVTAQGKVQVLSRLIGAQSTAAFQRVIREALSKVP